MSPINNSALSCVATAVGCTLTGMAVNEHLNPPNQTTGPIKLGIQENPLMNAEDLMIAASDGVEPSVAPPEQMFTQDLTPSVKADDVSNFVPKQPEIWQRSPLDIGNLVAEARPLPRTERLNVKPMGNFSDEYFPDYLNFDQQGSPPEPLEMAMEKLPEPEITRKPMSVSDFPSGLVPVPAPPPLFEGEAIASEYIIAPDAIISNSFEGISRNNIDRPDRAINPSLSQYIVEPQSMIRVSPQLPQARENLSAKMPEFSVANSAKLAAQYVVEPRRVMAVFPAEQSGQISEVNHLESSNPIVYINSRDNSPQTTVASGVNSQPSAINSKPKLLQKLVEPYQFPSEVMADEEVYPPSYTPENNQIDAEIAANSLKDKAEIIVAVEPEFDSASESIIEESEEEIEQMPSLLKKLVESYSESSDVMHDIKVSPSPLKGSESKFARY
ncbi:hypothetical protein ACL6C3_12660 [Capilliphycus salinus ALCB114379]|uniref:hypothetical protein n=1 Tax=Capilliphycus salinus TaxID=2768948 RepID=UPI0039A43C9E